MSNRKCCVPGCVNSIDKCLSDPKRFKIETQVNLHKFSNPAVDKELFNTWVYSIGGDILHLENSHIFKYHHVCHVHFEEKYWCRYNRITKDAVPTINMPGLSYIKFYSERRPLRPLQMFEPSTSKEPVTSNLDSVVMEPDTPRLSAGDVQVKENLGYHSALPG